MPSPKLDRSVVTKVIRNARAIAPNGPLDRSHVEQLVGQWILDAHEAARHVSAILVPLGDCHTSEHCV